MTNKTLKDRIIEAWPIRKPATPDAIVELILKHYDKNPYGNSMTNEEFNTALINVAFLMKQGEITTDVDPDSLDVLPSYIGDLIHLKKHITTVVEDGVSFDPSFTETPKVQLFRGCHPAAALNYALCPKKYDICTGISERYHAHSWLVLKGTRQVVECTPIPRDYYFGVVLNDPIAFLKEEVYAISHHFSLDEITSQDMKAFMQFIEKT